MTDQELRDKLAGHLIKTSLLHKVMGYTHAQAFCDGWNAARANPPPEVEALVRALEAIDNYEQTYGFPTPGEWSVLVAAARDNLKAYRAARDE